MSAEDHHLDIILGIGRKMLRGSVCKDLMEVRFKARLHKIRE
jgi:hypothetical protein